MAATVSGCAVVPHRRAAQADARRTIERARRRGRAQFQYRADELDVVDRARDQPDGVEAFGRGVHAPAIERAEGGLEAEHAAIGGGAQHRAAGLRAERRRHHQVGDRRARSARRAAGRMGRVVRIGGDARRHAGEFAGHGLAEDHGACRAHQRDAGGVGDGPVAAIDRRAHLGRQVGGVDDVLDADRHAMQRAARGTAVEVVRLAQRELGIDRGPGVDVLLARVDAREAVADHVLAGGFARDGRAGDLARRKLVQADRGRRAQHVQFLFNSDRRERPPSRRCGRTPRRR